MAPSNASFPAPCAAGDRTAVTIDAASNSPNAITGLSLKPPVFVVGCPRSGNHMLYHSLLSSGGFAVYEIHSHVFNILGRKFGSLRVLSHRQKLMDAWLAGWLFKYTGLDRELIRKRILDECRSAGDFLRIVMEEMCRKQNVGRWAENTPDHVFYLHEIRRAFPDARFVHVIRDGRDVALSLQKIGWIPPLPWHRTQSWIAAALFWDWSVRKARQFGAEAGRGYMEVHFENLVLEPEKTLEKVGSFIEYPLDYGVIQRRALGAVRKPNTVFQEGLNSVPSSPVGRWEKSLRPREISQLELLIGPLLRDLGYNLATPKQPEGLSVNTTRFLYHSIFETKLWLKSRTPMGRLMRAGLIRGDTDIPPVG